MNNDSLKYVLYGLVSLVIGINVLYFIYLNYRSWKTNNAPVETSRAVAYYKDPEIKASIDGRSNTYFYHITFHTESGDILTLYMLRDQYHRIPEGASGELTWQNKRFWKFKMEDGTEVKG